MLTISLLAAGCGGSTPAEETMAVDLNGGPLEVRVLFVGNSYTLNNDLPNMVETIAAVNGVDIDADVQARGGYRLDQHFEDGEVAGALETGDYDVVVLQDQSQIPAHGPTLRLQSLPAAARLGAVAGASDVRVVWFQTWGREHGSTELGLRTFDDMQQALVAGYAQLADQIPGSVIADVGESWQRLRHSGLQLDLFAEDGSHPSPAGSYAAAVSLLETIVGAPVLVAPAVGGVDEATAAAIVAFD